MWKCWRFQRANVPQQPQWDGLHGRGVLIGQGRRHQRGEDRFYVVSLVLPSDGSRRRRLAAKLTFCGGFLPLQYGNVGAMAITLCQSLGQNVGMRWNNARNAAGENVTVGTAEERSLDESVSWEFCPSTFSPNLHFLREEEKEVAAAREPSCIFF